jgi:hypothetical protein
MKLDKNTINVKSTLVSGLCAGAVIIIVGAGLVPILGDQMDKALTRLSVPPLTNAAMSFFGIMSLILGIAIMWIYALVHHNFKNDLKAVIVIALFFWFFTYFWSNAALVAYQFLPLEIAGVGTIYGLLELVIAGFVGSKIYRKPKDKTFETE